MKKTQTFQKKMTKTAEERLQNVGGGSFVKKKRIFQFAKLIRMWEQTD